MATMVNRVVHFEVPVDDADRAGAFYRAAFDWRVDQWGDVPYWPMTTGEPPGIGAEGALTPRSDAPEGVLVYVQVDDIDPALERIRSAGGAVVAGRTAIPGTGWFATFRDPEGNLLGLYQNDPPAA
jgi:uncharacterized protein